MWPFKRKKHVVLVIHRSGTHYLAKDLKLTSDADEALGFPSGIEAGGVAYSLCQRGISATSATIRR